MMFGGRSSSTSSCARAARASCGFTATATSSRRRWSPASRSTSEPGRLALLRPLGLDEPGGLRLQSGFLGGAGNLVFNRFTGPGRVGLQSAYYHPPGAETGAGGGPGAAIGAGGGAGMIGGLLGGLLDN